MAENGFRNMVLAFMLFSLMAFLSVNFISTMGTSHGVDTSTIGGESFDIATLNNSVEGLDDTSESLRKRFEDSTEAGLDIETTLGIGKIFTDITTFIFTPFDILGQILHNIIGLPSIVISVFLAILVLVGIFGLWKTFKAGS